MKAHGGTEKKTLFGEAEGRKTLTNKGMARKPILLPGKNTLEAVLQLITISIEQPHTQSPLLKKLKKMHRVLSFDALRSIHMRTRIIMKDENATQRDTTQNAHQNDEEERTIYLRRCGPGLAD